jgi:Tol biopolymer transport system component
VSRQPQATRPGPAPQPSNRASRGESGGGGRTPIIAPLLGLIALVAIAAGSLWTISLLGLTDSTAATPTDPPDIQITANPSAGVEASVVAVTPTPTPHSTVIVTPPPDKTAEVVGTILVSKQGDIYSVTGKGDIKRVQGTKTGDNRYNTAPVWMPDGKRFLFVQTIERQVQAPYNGKLTKYTFFYPNIMSVAADGGDPKLVYESIFPSNGGRWFSWVLQPDVSPDGKTIALVTDGKDGYGDVMLGTMTIAGNQLKQLANVPSIDGQGHNDPEWSPDGRTIAFTYNYRRQGTGVPKIGLYNVRSGQTKLLKGGYANPSWSPDGRVIVAERTDGNGRDIVIVDPRNGAEIARLTTDGNSFAPTFSPNGDQVAFLRRDGLTVNLWLMTLDPANGYTRVEVKPVTDDPDGLDAESPPTWFIPQSDRKPLITPRPDVLPSIEATESLEPEASAAP